MNVIAFGNPLLDTIVLTPTDSLLRKHNLDPDGQKEVSQTEMESLKKDIAKYEQTVTAGGCAQNTLRIFQWLFPQPCTATMFGAVGDDSEGALLKELLKKNKVDARYLVNSRLATGSSVAIVSGDKRSLVAHLGAAEVVNLEHLKENFQIFDQLKEADLVYLEGFFITNGRSELSSSIVDFCNSVKKKVAFNLSGQYLCKQYSQEVNNLVQKSDIIFGNKKEFKTFCTYLNEKDVTSFIRKLGEKGKIVVMTNGSSSVICVGDKGNLFYEMEVPQIQKENIVDTTGAGDSFVAGFLTGYLLEKPLQHCVEIGCYAAQEIIQRRGCTLPEYNSTISSELN